MNNRSIIERSAHGSADEMPSRTAIFDAEHPLAIVRDFPDGRDQAKVLAAVDRALAQVADDDPPAHEAWRRRQGARARGVVGADEATKRILTWKRSGAPMPALPDAPLGR